MPTIMNSSFIRVLFIAAIAGVCLFNQSKTASAQTAHKYRALIEAATGTFAGESICVGKQPDCKNEKVVYVVEPTDPDTGEIMVTSDLLQGDVRVPVFRQKLRYDQKIHYFTGRFLTARDLVRDTSKASGTRAGTGGRIYTITITSTHTSNLEGTLWLTDGDTVLRRLKLKRVKPDQVPPAPSASMYQSQ